MIRPTMTSENFFRYLQRFNSLIPAGALLLLIGSLGWAFVSDRGLSRGRQIAPPAGVNVSSEEKLRIQSANFDGDANNLIFLVNADGPDGDYEGRSSETRNLLFVSTDSEKARWLFQDQKQILHRIVPLQNSSNVAQAIYIETKLPVAGDKKSGHQKTTLNIVKSNGSKLTPFVSNVEDVMGYKENNNDLQVTYLKDNAIRSIRISLLDFTIKSDNFVVSLGEVKK